MNHQDEVNSNREKASDAVTRLEGPASAGPRTASHHSDTRERVPPEDHINTQLDALRNQGLERTLRTVPGVGGILTDNGRRILNFSSNDYLGFARRPELIAAAKQALDNYGAGSGASRLVTGTLPIHDDLETALARHKGYPASLVFGSGYMTNAGVISALCDRDWTVIADRLIHASLIDAIATSGATLKRFRHNDPEDLKQHLTRASRPDQTLVVTESVFSMDGDLAPLPAIADLCADHEVMFMVDEAHATGVFGPAGSGLIAAHRLQSRVALSMCTFSKGLGTYGGAVACSELLRTWMIHKARAFIYTTAPPPSVIASTLAAIHLLDREPHLGQTLLTTAHAFRDRLNAAGIDTLQTSSQIIPVLIGDNHKAVAVDHHLRDQGILASALRPPTVPPGKARLRLSITLEHTPEDLDRAFHALLGALDAEGCR